MKDVGFLPNARGVPQPLIVRASNPDHAGVAITRRQQGTRPYRSPADETRAAEVAKDSMAEPKTHNQARYQSRREHSRAEQNVIIEKRDGDDEESQVQQEIREQKCE